jgi:hypothetical protein
MATSEIEHFEPSDIADEVEKSNRRRIVNGLAEQIYVEVRDCVVSG